MNINTIRKLYESQGFRWTTHLENLMREYAGERFLYDRPTGNGDSDAHFYDESRKIPPSSSRVYKLTSHFLKEDVVPVGQCNDQDLYLLLTESGNLVGFGDYLLFSWSSNDSPNWQESIDNLLDGKDCHQIGHAALG